MESGSQQFADNRCAAAAAAGENQTNEANWNTMADKYHPIGSVDLLIYPPARDRICVPEQIFSWNW